MQSPSFPAQDGKKLLDWYREKFEKRAEGQLATNPWN